MECSGFSLGPLCLFYLSFGIFKGCCFFMNCYSPICSFCSFCHDSTLTSKGQTPCSNTRHLPIQAFKGSLKNKIYTNKNSLKIVNELTESTWNNNPYKQFLNSCNPHKRKTVKTQKQNWIKKKKKPCKIFLIISKWNFIKLIITVVGGNHWQILGCTFSVWKECYIGSEEISAATSW